MVLEQSLQVGAGAAILSCILDVPYPIFTSHFDMTHTAVTVIEFAENYGVLTPILKGAKNLNPDEITEEEKVFAEELEMLLIDDNMRAGYQNKAVKRAADFGMEAYVKEIERLIAEDT